MSRVLLNPKVKTLGDVTKLANLLDNHIWFMSSGTGISGSKWVGLSEEALRASAEAVNAHLQISRTDRWLNVLPRFHVGGYGIFLRAELSQSIADDLSMFEWDAKRMIEVAKAQRSTILSLVPTQVFDLVKGKFEAPPSLRHVIVGGGALTFDLAKKANDLGWPIRSSFGMTECGSQIATALHFENDERNFCRLPPLSHVSLRLNNQQILQIKSKALFTAYAQWQDNQWLLKERDSSDWWTSEDMVELTAEGLRPLGRASRKLKILGELVDLDVLTQKANLICAEMNLTLEALVVAKPDQRKQYELMILVDQALAENRHSILAEFNRRVAPFERSFEIREIGKFERTSLGKISMKEIARKLGVDQCS